MKRKARCWPGRYRKPFNVEWHCWIPDNDDSYLRYDGARLATAEEIADLRPDFSVFEPQNIIGNGRKGGPNKRHDPKIYFGKVAAKAGWKFL